MMSVLHKKVLYWWITEEVISAEALFSRMRCCSHPIHYPILTLESAEASQTRAGLDNLSADYDSANSVKLLRSER